ncbi:MAG: hypothetical protein IT462_17360 [Planctomycetes bacterium]|nr:hypothetical protein [Planctomycetota bacterium]
MKSLITLGLLSGALLIGSAVPAIAQDKPTAVNPAIDIIIGWEKLGETRVDGSRRRSDRDTIYVGRSEGRFSSMMIKVEDADIELYDVVVTFANGETFSPELRRYFEAGQRSRSIDLPGRRRAIQKVDFSFRNTNRHGRATVELWAR